jgi:hypothetical protein
MQSRGAIGRASMWLTITVPGARVRMLVDGAPVRHERRAVTPRGDRCLRARPERMRCGSLASKQNVVVPLGGTLREVVGIRDGVTNDDSRFFVLRLAPKDRTGVTSAHLRGASARAPVSTSS